MRTWGHFCVAYTLILNVALSIWRRHAVGLRLLLLVTAMSGRSVQPGRPGHLRLHPSRWAMEALSRQWEASLKQASAIDVDQFACLS